MVNDPISDLLIRLKNAALVKKESVLLPYSKLKLEVANILKERGYLSAVEKRGRKQAKLLELSLAWEPDGRAKLHGVKRVSKPSRRIYSKAAELKPIKRGFGLAVISTSKGLKADAAARREKLGGEVLLEVW